MKTPEKKHSLHLIIQLYGNENDIHFKRMSECIYKNAELNFVKMITIVCDLNTTPPPNGDKIRVLFSDKRSSYANLLSCALPSDKGQGTTHFALANSDIFLSGDIYKCMENITHASHVAAISRREINGRLVENPYCSQDLWLFKSHDPSPQLLESSWNLLGIAGCEHLFAMSLYCHGYSIWNPCLDCSILHNDPIPKTSWEKRYFGSYLFLPPCSIAEIAAKPPKYKFNFARTKIANASSDAVTSLKLHLCCGDKKIPGFMGVDIRRDVNPDILGSIEDLSMIESESVDEIYFCHGLEHIEIAKSKGCLRELNRVLKKSGVLRLALPNFEALATLYVQGRVELKEIILAIHGGQDYEHNYHYSSWDFTSLSKILSENGFEDVKRYEASEFLPSNYFDWSLHSLCGINTSLNVECIKSD